MNLRIEAERPFATDVPAAARPVDREGGLPDEALLAARKRRLRFRVSFADRVANALGLGARGSRRQEGDAGLAHPIERNFLARAVDHQDLERRQRAVDRGELGDYRIL